MGQLGVCKCSKRRPRRSPKKDKISVVIRTRNEERWIGHVIQSVIDHLDKPEIIIVDNIILQERLTTTTYLLSRYSAFVNNILILNYEVLIENTNRKLISIHSKLKHMIT